jgi:hypothetical protein
VYASQKEYFIAIGCHFDGFANRPSVKGSMFIHFGFSSRFSHVPILFAVSLGIYWVFVFVSDVELGVCRSIFAQPRLFARRSDVNDATIEASRGTIFRSFDGDDVQEVFKRL